MRAPASRASLSVSLAPPLGHAAGLPRSFGCWRGARRHGAQAWRPPAAQRAVPRARRWLHVARPRPAALQPRQQRPTVPPDYAAHQGGPQGGGHAHAARCCCALTPRPPRLLQAPKGKKVAAAPSAVKKAAAPAKPVNPLYEKRPKTFSASRCCCSLLFSAAGPQQSGWRSCITKHGGAIQLAGCWRMEAAPAATRGAAATFCSLCARAACLPPIATLQASAVTCR